MAHALLADDLGDDVVAQRPHGVCGVGQAAAQVHLRVRLHLRKGEDLLVARLVEGGALGVASASGKLRPQFLVVQNQPVASSSLHDST